MIDLEAIFRQCHIRPSLLIDGKYQQSFIKIALGQQVWICLTVEPPEYWGRSVEDFVKTFEQHTQNIVFSYSLMTGSKMLVRQETPFIFEDRGDESDNDEPEMDAPRVRRSETGLEFRMGIQLKIESQHYNKSLKMLLSLSYNMEFGLSSNALQVEAARRSSTLDGDRNDHLRGYVGMDEEELEVRQLMEFNRFRATKVPPREVELTVSIVKPLCLSSYCSEESPCSTLLTLTVQNVHPSRDINVHGVVLHLKDSIKGATLLESPPQHPEALALAWDAPETGNAGRLQLLPKSSASINTPSGPSTDVDGTGASLVQADLLGGDGEQDKEDLEVVDLDDAAAAGAGNNTLWTDIGEINGEFLDVGLENESSARNLPQSQPYRLGDDLGHEEEEGADAQLSADNAYLMQFHGHTLDASTLFRFTALDALSTLQEGGSGSALAISSGETRTLCYRVEPRMTDSEQGQPYLYSSLLLGDFFSPVSIMWSEIPLHESHAGGSSGLSRPSGGQAHQVESHVAYWSVGKRWANACAFDSSYPTRSSDEGSISEDISRRTPVKQAGSGTPLSARAPVGGHSKVALPGIGTAVGVGTPLREQTSNSSHRSSRPIETKKGSFAVATVVTPSKMAYGSCPPGSTTTALNAEGGFTLSITGPESVPVGKIFTLSVEIRNKSDNAISGLSLSVGSSEGQEGYVVHESLTKFPELLWPQQSVKQLLHVYPLRIGVLNFTSIQVKDRGDIAIPRQTGLETDHQETNQTYDFLQFFSCMVTE